MKLNQASVTWTGAMQYHITMPKDGVILDVFVEDNYLKFIFLADNLYLDTSNRVFTVLGPWANQEELTDKAAYVGAFTHLTAYTPKQMQVGETAGQPNMVTYTTPGETTLNLSDRYQVFELLDIESA